MRWPFEPTDPNAFLPSEVLLAVLNDDEARSEDGTPRFTMLNVAAINADRSHRAVPKDRRELIWTLLRKHFRT